MILRTWRDEDYAPYAALNADPEVCRYWTATLSMEESNAQAAGLQKHIDEHGFGFWAAEAPGVARFIGFIGLKHAEPDLPFAPGVEAGWRLARNYWGRGYATEGAQASLADGFERLGLKEIVAYTVALNAPSRRVMERIGMTHDPAADFDHKNREPNDPHRCYVVYRKTRDER
jgi:RimJ/RimL family protein N-acetyltransferase